MHVMNRRDLAEEEEAPLGEPASARRVEQQSPIKWRRVERAAYGAERRDGRTPAASRHACEGGGHGVA